MKERTNNFSDIDHLQKEYFLDVSNVYNIAKDYPNIELIKGDFKNTTDNVNQEIDILFLDCDLYKSYHICLDNLVKRLQQQSGQ